MKVTAIMATCGRHTCLERSVKLFMNQDYPKKELIIFNNSDVPQILDRNLPDNIKLINCSFDLDNKKPYSNLGEIYKDAIKFISKDTKVVVFWDDDDIFLPNHLSEGVKGYLEARSMNKLAYKPAKSYSKYMTNPVELVQNTLEPSIFVNKDHIIEYGFSNKTTEQHLKWVDPLVANNLIYVKEDGIPTMIYNWGDPFFTFKTSGDFQNPENFNNYRRNSIDHGDFIISPVLSIDYNKYLT